MIERKFVGEKMREFLVNQYLLKELGAGKYSSFELSLKILNLVNPEKSC